MPRIQRLVIAAIATVFLLTACGGTSSSLPESAAPDTVAVASMNEAAPSEAAPAQAEAAATGQPAGTLALSNGETFGLNVRSCETQSTDPDSYFTDDFFDLSGETTDGQYYFSANKVTTVDETLDALQFGLSGERDENGNPKIAYLNHARPGVDGSPQVGVIPGVFAVDGSRVTGEVILVQGFSENPAFGETVTATFEFICG